LIEGDFAHKFTSLRTAFCILLEELVKMSFAEKSWKNIEIIKQMGELFESQPSFPSGIVVEDTLQLFFNLTKDSYSYVLMRLFLFITLLFSLLIVNQVLEKSFTWDV